MEITTTEFYEAYNMLCLEANQGRIPQESVSNEEAMELAKKLKLERIKEMKLKKIAKQNVEEKTL